jgi:hypothetical protein
VEWHCDEGGLYCVCDWRAGKRRSPRGVGVWDGKVVLKEGKAKTEVDLVEVFVGTGTGGGLTGDQQGSAGRESFRMGVPLRIRTMVNWAETGTVYGHFTLRPALAPLDFPLLIRLRRSFAPSPTYVTALTLPSSDLSCPGDHLLIQHCTATSAIGTNDGKKFPRMSPSLLKSNLQKARGRGFGSHLAY